MAGVNDAQAITAWARKYGVSCNVCHVNGYKLTAAGQKFLRGGHQMPGGETGKEANLSDYLAMTAKIRTWGTTTVTHESGKDDVRAAKSSFEMHALSLYSGGPLSNGFSYFSEFYLHENEKKFTASASEANVSDMGDWGRSKLAEAFLQYDYKVNENAGVFGRAGRIMPWLIHLHGGGARLEYARGLPLQSTFGDNPYRPFARQYGVSFGGSYKDLFAEMGVVNGTGKLENAHEVDTDPHKDVYGTLDYTLDSNGSMLGVYYYRGSYPLHFFGKAKGRDLFYQAGLMGNYTFDVTEKHGGALIGMYLFGNNRYRATTAVTEEDHRSATYSLQAQGHLWGDKIGPYFRWEHFDPDKAKTDNETYGPVLGLNWKPFDHGRFVFEYSKYTKRVSQTKRTYDRAGTLEMQYMF
ncbi:MAG: hypothetical protein HY554_14195 [Elusimicrobia bacterium]|nr:hypothetical protein [Elusimicrobiota bacterium]